MRLPSTLALLMIGLVLLGGCHNVQTRSYDISVKNESSKTVILWLTKNGPPWENGWKSPEDIAIESPRADEPYPFQTVPPGKTASASNIKGQFEPGVDAILRVYVGQHSFNELLAINSDSPDRIEVKLEPGANNLDIVNSDGTVDVRRIGTSDSSVEPQ